MPGVTRDWNPPTKQGGAVPEASLLEYRAWRDDQARTKALLEGKPTKEEEALLALPAPPTPAEEGGGGGGDAVAASTNAGDGAPEALLKTIPRLRIPPGATRAEVLALLDARIRIEWD